MQQWEYMAASVSGLQYPVEFFNHQGLQGWELTAIENNIAYFKRLLSCSIPVTYHIKND